MTLIDPDSEGALETNTIRLFQSLGWEFANCYHEICGSNSTLGRETTEQVVLEWRLRAALEKLNPDVPPLALDLALDELTKDRSVLSPVRANQEVHNLLKDGIKVTYRSSDDNEAVETVTQSGVRDAAIEPSTRGLDCSAGIVPTQSAIVWRENSEGNRGITMTWFFAMTLIFAGFLTPLSATPSSSSAGLLLVANKGDRTLGLIDPDSGRQIATIMEGGVTGHEVVASPDGKRTFVPIYGDSGVGLPGTDGSTMDVIDLSGRKVIQTIDFGHGVRPHCAVFGPKDGLLYVTTELDKSVTIIDPHSLKIVGGVPTGQAESHMLAISPDGSKGYTANVGPGTVSVLDLAGRKTLTVIPVAGHVQRISLSSDGHWAFTSDTEKPRLAVIDTATNKVDRWVTLPDTGYGTAPTPDGKWLLVAIPSTNEVAVVDIATMRVVRTIKVPPSPQEVLVRPDGRAAYVSCSSSHQIAKIQIDDWSVKLIEAGRGADGLAWAK